MGTEVDSELELRWSAWLLAQNRRGTRTALSIAVCLYPAFGVLDYLIAPRKWLWLLYGTRAAVTITTIVLFGVVKSSIFARHTNAISASYMVLISFGISLMTLFMGGLSSPYYAGLSLTLVATGLLFVWPVRVVVATHVAIVLSFIIPNLIAGTSDDWLPAISNQFFLVSTAIIAGSGQVLAYRSQREQVESQRRSETATTSLARAHEQLEQLDRIKSEFFASITHELKTPLTLILAPLGLMIDGQLGKITPPQRSTLLSIQRNGVKLSRLLGDLLDLSKLEESRLRLRLEQHDLVDYLRGLVDQIHPFAARKGISISLEADTAEAWVWCDLERMERVFLNLLSNATKFTDPGGAIRIRVKSEAAAYRVEVSDTGVGFPSQMAARVFDRFMQADAGAARRHGGAGIGLSLARKLVELHGGTIWAESAPGAGARFNVRLLVGKDHFSEEVLDRRGPWVALVDGQRESDGGLADWQRGTPKHFRLMDIDAATEQRLLERDSDENSREHSVLVVEDTPDVARVIRLALHHEFRFLAARDGVQGLELARRHRPTIIITDWMMPRMDGIELTQRLRRDPETKHIPVVMLSARGLVEDKIKGLDAGVNAYLAKPFAASELVSTVRALLRTQEGTAEALLTQKMDSLETIAGGLAHEINNPLNYLKNALASVERDCETLLGSVKSAVPGPPESGVVEKLDTRMHKMFEVSRAGVDRIRSTVELMVRYSREGYSRSPRPYDAYGAVRDVARIVRLSFSPELRLIIDLEGRGIINCVPEELNQVLTNLIQNALEAVPADGSGQVVVKGREDEGHLVLSVKDNGPGIEERDRARVFDAFYTTKAVGQGMGMGLTITRRVVLAMGGSVSLKSQVGAGSEFSIRVPRLEAVEAAG